MGKIGLSTESQTPISCCTCTFMENISLLFIDQIMIQLTQHMYSNLALIKELFSATWLLKTTTSS